MLKNPKDTYRSTQQAIAQRVMANPLVGCVSTFNLERLKSQAAGEAEISSWTYFGVEFARAGSRCELNVRLDEPFSGSHELDAEGNEWTTYDINFTVSYPAHGSEDPATVLARAKLIADVAVLAAELQGEFKSRRDIWRMTATKEQLAERKAQAEANRIQQVLQTVIYRERKGMRVGSIKALRHDARWTPASQLPPGEHHLNVGEANGDRKEYVLRVSDVGDVELERLA